MLLLQGTSYCGKCCTAAPSAHHRHGRMHACICAVHKYSIVDHFVTMPSKPRPQRRPICIMRRNPHPRGSDAHKAFHQSELVRLGADDASLERKRKQATNWLGDTPAEREKNRRIIRDLGKTRGAAFKKKLQRDRVMVRPRVYARPGGRKLLASQCVRRKAQAKAEAGVQVKAETGVQVKAEAGVQVKAETGVQVKAEAGVQVKAEAGVQVKAEVKTKGTTESKAKGRAKRQTQVKTEVKGANTAS